MNLYLEKGQTLSVRSTPLILGLETGVLWITKTGSQEDIILGSGEKMSLRGPGWVLQALEDSRGTWSWVPCGPCNLTGIDRMDRINFPC